MIVTITLNPAIDKSTSIDSLLAEKKLRCSTLQIEPGGGGINVSKALAKLGTKSIAVFPSGGLNGQLLEKFMKDLNIEFRSIPIEGETRESFTVDESRTNAQYRFVLPGPQLTQADIDGIFKLLKSIQPIPEYIISSGSLPHGLRKTFLNNWQHMRNPFMPGASLILPVSHWNWQ